MKINFECDSSNRFSNKDCIEVHGVCGERISVLFYMVEKKVLQFTIDYDYGWDVATYEETNTDITSGTLQGCFEYKLNKPYTLCFEISVSEITVVLNEHSVTMVSLPFDIGSISNISFESDNPIKSISFSDSTKTDSRVIQPAIYQTVQSDQTQPSLDESSSNQVFFIESRRRIVLKSGTPPLNGNDNDGVIDVDDDSDDDSDGDDDSDISSCDELFYTDHIHHNNDHKNLHDILHNIHSISSIASLKYTIDMNPEFYVLNYFELDESTTATSIITMANTAAALSRQKSESYTHTSYPDFLATDIYNLRSSTKKVIDRLESTGEEIKNIRSASSSIYPAKKKRRIPRRLKSTPATEDERKKSFKFSLNGAVLTANKDSRIPIFNTSKR